MAKDVGIVDSERERFFCSHYGSAGGRVCEVDTRA
jgi:hypothetical protein